MGVSTDGQICYGILFEEGVEFPWDDERFDGDMDDWWLFEVLKFRHSFEIYDPDGNYIDGTRPSQERISEYYNESREFLKANPCPVTKVTHCSCDYPMCILAVPHTFKYAS